MLLVAEYGAPPMDVGEDPELPKGGKTVKIDKATYADLELLAAVTKQSIAKLARDLLRTPLALMKGKLGPEIAKHEKMQADRDELAVKARKKIKDAD